MRYTATTHAVDGRELKASGKTMPEAIRNAAKKRAEHERSKTTITIAEGVTYVRRG